MAYHNYSHNFGCKGNDPKCSACEEQKAESSVKHAVMVKGRPEHSLGCDDMHQHQAPQCCRPACWCHDLEPVKDKLKLRAGATANEPFLLEICGQRMDLGINAVDVQLRAGQIHKVVVTFNAAEIDIEIKGKLGD